jgi:hypothetical protein
LAAPGTAQIASGLKCHPRSIGSHVAGDSDHEVGSFETTAASFGIGAWLVGTTTMDEFDGPKTKLPLLRYSGKAAC